MLLTLFLSAFASEPLPAPIARMAEGRLFAAVGGGVLSHDKVQPCVSTTVTTEVRGGAHLWEHAALELQLALPILLNPTHCGGFLPSERDPVYGRGHHRGQVMAAMSFGNDPWPVRLVGSLGVVRSMDSVVEWGAVDDREISALHPGAGVGLRGSLWPMGWVGLDLQGGLTVWPEADPNGRRSIGLAPGLLGSVRLGPATRSSLVDETVRVGSATRWSRLATTEPETP